MSTKSEAASSRRLRVELRAPTAADTEEFIAAMLSSRTLHRPWLTPATTPEAFENLLRRVDDDRYDPQLVRRREDGAIVGFINISEIVRGAAQYGFIGYGGVAAYAGRGYMTEGLQLMLRRAFTQLGLHRLEANIQPDNTTSIALARRLGFVREGFSERYLKIGGRWRDHERWAIRSEQWRAANRTARPR
jgi:[ribosomal protein S5]-alanine N-acetyltransferase